MFHNKEYNPLVYYVCYDTVQNIGSFTLGFTELSRIFTYIEQVVGRGWMKAGAPGDEPSDLPVQSLAPHMYPRRGSNHSGEEIRYLRVGALNLWTTEARSTILGTGDSRCSITRICIVSSSDGPLEIVLWPFHASVRQLSHLTGYPKRTSDREEIF